MHAGSAVLSKMPYDLPLGETDMVGVRPTQGTFGIHGAQVIAAGDPYRSILWYRMAKLGSGRMPHIGSLEVDEFGLALIHDWITQLPKTSAVESLADGLNVDEQQSEASLLNELDHATDEASQTAVTAKLLSTPDRALRLIRFIDSDSAPKPWLSVAVEQARQHDDASVRDLFERFLPAGQRVKRLSGSVLPDQILSISGDADRGKTLFFASSGLHCKNCHQIDRPADIPTEGAPPQIDLGPNLTKIGEKQTREQLLESILEPSKRIEPKYVSYLVETHDGQVLTGLLVSKTEKDVVLRDSQGKVTDLSASQVEQLVPQGQSLMPEMLLRDLTAQQASDLLAYLVSLK
jgi:putative heme-binding domain-containing protein